MGLTSNFLLVVYLNPEPRPTKAAFARWFVVDITDKKITRGSMSHRNRIRELFATDSQWRAAKALIFVKSPMMTMDEFETKIRWTVEAERWGILVWETMVLDENSEVIPIAFEMLRQHGEI